MQSGDREKTISKKSNFYALLQILFYNNLSKIRRKVPTLEMNTQKFSFH